MRNASNRLVRSLFVVACAGLLAAVFPGCGPSQPATPQVEIEKSADAHSAVVRDMAQKYKKGPKGHAGK